MLLKNMNAAASLQESSYVSFLMPLRLPFIMDLNMETIIQFIMIFFLFFFVLYGLFGD